jgi:hypothetical protein
MRPIRTRRQRWSSEYPDRRAASTKVSSSFPSAASACRISAADHSMPLAPSSLPNTVRWRTASVSMRASTASRAGTPT